MIDPAHIENALPALPEGRYASIIGRSPSKGARSPILWNAAFAALADRTRMFPFDVSEDGLDGLLTALDADPLFIGGSVAMPHKESVARWLGASRMAPTVRAIGAVNCLFRAPDGVLRGTNTDGAAAQLCVESTLGALAGKQVLVIGAGGAGKAIAGYFAEAGAQLRLASRDPARIEAFAASVGAKTIGFPLDRREAALTQLLVNCTPIGFGALSAASPVEAEFLAHLPASAGVYDIIYDPCPTPLLSAARAAGFPILDGRRMNLEQAILAFRQAVPTETGAEEVISSAMHAAASAL